MCYLYCPHTSASMSYWYVSYICLGGQLCHFILLCSFRIHFRELPSKFYPLQVYKLLYEPFFNSIIVYTEVCFSLYRICTGRVAPHDVILGHTWRVSVRQWIATSLVVWGGSRSRNLRPTANKRKGGGNVVMFSGNGLVLK